MCVCACEIEREREREFQNWFWNVSVLFLRLFYVIFITRKLVDVSTGHANASKRGT